MTATIFHVTDQIERTIGVRVRLNWWRRATCIMRLSENEQNSKIDEVDEVCGTFQMWRRPHLLHTTPGLKVPHPPKSVTICGNGSAPTDQFVSIKLDTKVKREEESVLIPPSLLPYKQKRNTTIVTLSLYRFCSSLFDCVLGAATFVFHDHIACDIATKRGKVDFGPSLEWLPFT